MEKRAEAKRERCRKDVLRRLKKLAGGRVNDAVKLAFLDGERAGEIDGLDLSAVAEFKRGGNGSVEVKLVDRVVVLEKLLDLLGQPEGGAEELLRALEEVPATGGGTPGGEDGGA